MNLFWLPWLMVRALLDPQMLLWLLYLAVPGWLLLPLFRRMLPESIVSWYFAPRVAALAFVGYILWLVGHDAAAAFNLPPETLIEAIANGPRLVAYDYLAIAAVHCLLALLSAAGWWVWGRETATALRGKRRELIAGELLFLAVLALAGALRLVSHGIVGQEKFMDMAFYRACIDSVAMPPADPWLYHLPINYYYGGYAIMAAPAKFFSTAPEIAYNLAASLLFALASTLVYSAGVETTRRVAGGIGAVAITLFAGNLSPILQFARHLRSTPHAPQFVFDWWEPSRVLHDQLPGSAPAALITEFPFFTFFHADLHPHMMAIPFALLFCVLVIGFHEVEWRSASRIRCGFSFGMVAWSLGLLLWINPFDYIGWSCFAGVLLLFTRTRAGLGSLLGRAAVYFSLCVLASLFVLPFLVFYQVPRVGSGPPAALTEFRSGIFEFGLEWGVQLLVLGPWLVFGCRRELARFRSETRFVARAGMGLLLLAACLFPGGVIAGCLFLAVLLLLWLARNTELRVSLALAASGLLLLLGCELFYIRDSYGRSLQRMNTVFKFHFIAWTMIGIGVPSLLRDVWRSLESRTGRSLFAATAAVIAAIGFSYPGLAIRERLAGYSALELGEPSYNGLRFMVRTEPADLGAIRWLRRNILGNPVLLEAPGGAYTEHSRISTFAPVRSVIGWANHQRVWRGIDTATIEAEAGAVYTTTSAEVQQGLLRKYGVGYIYVGTIERQTYPAEALDRLRGRFATVYSSEDGTVLIHGVEDAGPPGR